jgi:hypothetical protein
LKVKTDYDPYDNVYHDPISTQEIQDTDLGKFPDELSKYLPFVVSQSLEHSNRMAICACMEDGAKSVILEALEKISVPGEYMGHGSNGDQVSVSCEAYVKSADLDDNDSSNVVLEIVNPVHLINDIISGVGQSFFTELSVDEYDRTKVESMLHNITDYFEVYEGACLEPSDHSWASYFDKDFFVECIDEMISDLTTEEISCEIMDSARTKEEFEEALSVIKEAISLSSSPLDPSKLEEDVRTECSRLAKKDFDENIKKIS